MKALQREGPCNSPEPVAYLSDEMCVQPPGHPGTLLSLGPWVMEGQGAGGLPPPALRLKEKRQPLAPQYRQM